MFLVVSSSNNTSAHVAKPRVNDAGELAIRKSTGPAFIAMDAPSSTRVSTTLLVGLGAKSPVVALRVSVRSAAFWNAFFAVVNSDAAISVALLAVR